MDVYCSSNPNIIDNLATIRSFAWGHVLIASQLQGGWLL